MQQNEGLPIILDCLKKHQEQPNDERFSLSKVALVTFIRLPALRDLIYKRFACNVLCILLVSIHIWVGHVTSMMLVKCVLLYGKLILFSLNHKLINVYLDGDFCWYGIEVLINWLFPKGHFSPKYDPKIRLFPSKVQCKSVVRAIYLFS